MIAASDAHGHRDGAGATLARMGAELMQALDLVPPSQVSRVGNDLRHQRV